MGKQNLPCTHSALFLMGMYKLYDHSEKIINMISKNIAPMIKGFDNSSPKSWTWDNWFLLRSALDAYDMKKMIDGGSQLMVQVSKQNGVCVQVYNTLKILDILKDPEDCKVTFEFDKDLDKNFSKWVNLLSSYESIIQEFNSMYLLLSTIAPMYQSPLQQNMEPKQIKDLTSKICPFNFSIIERYCPELEILKPSLENKSLEYYTWKNYAEYAAWNDSTSIESLEYVDFNNDDIPDTVYLPSAASMHRIPWDTIQNCFTNIVAMIRNQYWFVFLIMERSDIPNIIKNHSIIEHVVTQGTLDSGIFYFSGLGYGYSPLYCECATVLEPSLPSKPMCYGMFLSDVCTNCSYLNECKGFKNYLYPSNISNKAGNYFTILPEQIPSIEVGSKIRLLIKTVKS